MHAYTRTPAHPCVLRVHLEIYSMYVAAFEDRPQQSELFLGQTIPSKKSGSQHGTHPVRKDTLFILALN